MAEMLWFLLAAWGMLLVTCWLLFVGCLRWRALRTTNAVRERLAGVERHSRLGAGLPSTHETTDADELLAERMASDWMRKARP